MVLTANILANDKETQNYKVDISVPEKITVKYEQQGFSTVLSVYQGNHILWRFDTTEENNNFIGVINVKEEKEMKEKEEENLNVLELISKAKNGDVESLRKLSEKYLDLINEEMQNTRSQLVTPAKTSKELGINMKLMLNAFRRVLLNYTFSEDAEDADVHAIIATGLPIEARYLRNAINTYKDQPKEVLKTLVAKRRDPIAAIILTDFPELIPAEKEHETPKSYIGGTLFSNDRKTKRVKSPFSRIPFIRRVKIAWKKSFGSLAEEAIVGEGRTPIIAGKLFNDMTPNKK